MPDIKNIFLLRETKIVTRPKRKLLELENCFLFKMALLFLLKN